MKSRTMMSALLAASLAGVADALGSGTAAQRKIVPVFGPAAPPRLKEKPVKHKRTLTASDIENIEAAKAKRARRALRKGM